MTPPVAQMRGKAPCALRELLMLSPARLMDTGAGRAMTGGKQSVPAH
jgi:hypothetical protein